MMNLNVAKGYTVVGKVVDGKVVMFAVKAGTRGIRVAKPISRTVKTPIVVVEQGVSTARLLGEKPVPTQDTLDVPDFMKARSKRMQEERRMKRIFKTV